MNTFSVPPISLLAVIGLITLLLYKIWLSFEQEKVRTRENTFRGRLRSSRLTRNCDAWSLKRTARALSYGLQNGLGVLIFCAKRFGTVRTVPSASSSTRYQSYLAQPTSKDFVNHPSYLPQTNLTYSQWAPATSEQRLQQTSRRFSTQNTKVLRFVWSEGKAEIYEQTSTWASESPSSKT